MVAQVDDKEVLGRLYQVVSELLSQTWAGDNELTAAQEARLTRDIEESYDPANLVDHEEVMKELSQWLEK